MNEDRCSQIRYDTLWLLRDNQWRETRLRPRINSIHIVLQHNAPKSLGNLDGENSIYIWYHTDEGLLNVKQLKSHTKNHIILSENYSSQIVAHTEASLGHITSCFAEITELFGLNTSLKKKEVLYQPSPQIDYCPLSVIIGSSKLISVSNLPF